MKDKEKSLIYEINGRDTFVKIKSALSIGKILFAFVQFGADKKQTSSIDCYMSAEEFGAFLARPITDKSLLMQIKKTKDAAVAAGKSYPDVVYNSPIGGTKKGDKPVSRSFSIAPGSRSEVIFTAQQYEADVSGTGAFVAKKGTKPIATIRVPATYKDLQMIAYIWNFIEKDYMSSKYSVAALTDDRGNYTSNTDVSTPTTPTETPESVKAPLEKAPATTTAEKGLYTIIPTSSAKVVEGFPGWAKVDVRLDESNTDSTVFFNPESIKQLSSDIWMDFQKAAGSNTKIKIFAKEQKGKLYFTKFA